MNSCYLLLLEYKVTLGTALADITLCKGKSYYFAVDLECNRDLIGWVKLLDLWLPKSGVCTEYDSRILNTLSKDLSISNPTIIKTVLNVIMVGQQHNGSKLMLFSIGLACGIFHNVNALQFQSTCL